eukprot:3936321-Rhodomonas_salina.2
MGTLMMVMDAACFASQSSVGMGSSMTMAKSVMTGTQLMMMGAQCVTDVCCDRTINNAGAEACDDGHSDDADWCTSCVINMCGDWVVNNAGTEECDDWNNIDADRCTSRNGGTGLGGTGRRQ